MLKQKRFMIITLCALFLLSSFQLTGCGSAVMSADYPFYEDEQSFFNHADLIITGEVVKVNKAEEIDIRIDKANRASNRNDDVLYTVSEIRAIDVMKGNIKTGDIIKVKQLGDKNSMAEEFLLKNDGYFKKNNQYVLFLGVFDNEIPSETLNPEQGQINIIDGVTKVYEINPLFKSGIPIDEFVAELKTKVNSYK